MFQAYRLKKTRPSLFWPPSVFMLSSSWSHSVSIPGGLLLFLWHSFSLFINGLSTLKDVFLFYSVHTPALHILAQGICKISLKPKFFSSSRIVWNWLINMQLCLTSVHNNNFVCVHVYVVNWKRQWKPKSEPLLSSSFCTLSCWPHCHPLFFCQPTLTWCSQPIICFTFPHF